MAYQQVPTNSGTSLKNLAIIEFSVITEITIIIINYLTDSKAEIINLMIITTIQV